MTILFYLKLNKFHGIGVMNKLKIIFYIYFFHTKKSFYWFNRQELLQKAKDRYHNCSGKEKVAKYYLEKKEIFKEKARNNSRNFSEEEQKAKRGYEKKQIQKHKIKPATAKKMRKQNIDILYSIKIIEKTLKVDNVKVNKKKFHVSKQQIALNLINVDQILTSDKFEHSDTGFNYFIGYKDDNIIRSLCMILPQMNGYIKYVFLMIEDDRVLVKNDEIWNKIKKNTLRIQFRNIPVYEEKLHEN